MDLATRLEVSLVILSIQSLDHQRKYETIIDYGYQNTMDSHSIKNAEFTILKIREFSAIYENNFL